MDKAIVRRDADTFGRCVCGVLAVLAVMAYAASDEWHQSFVPLRDPDVHDWLADLLGGSVGAVAFGAFSHKYGRMRT